MAVESERAYRVIEILSHLKTFASNCQGHGFLSFDSSPLIVNKDVEY